MPSPLRSLARAAALAALLVAPPTLHAQSNAARVANDTYARSHDYDLVHQRITLRDFDWDSTSFAGQVVTTLVALRPAMDSVILDAGALLQVDRARDARGVPLRTTARGDSLVVHFGRAAGFRDTVRFTLDYHGRVRNGRGLTFILPDGRPHRPQQIWSQGEAMNNHLWFPTYDFPNDKMTWEMVVTVPRRFTVVSNGRLVSDHRNRDGTHTVDWRQDRPSATYLVSLIIGDLVRLRDRWRGVPVDYYVYRADSARAWRLFHVTPRMIDVYSRLTGVPYPWAKYAQTTVADFFGGMENVSATTLVDWLPDARAYRDRPWYQWLLIPHELAHQWFGDYVTTEDWANTWLNEGFAEFMPGQYWEQTLGIHAAQDYYLNEYQRYMHIDARRRMPLATLASNDIYPKGALVLRLLKDYLGPQRFWASLHEYLARHAHGTATTDDLRQAVLRATGENLSWFWSEWMYQAGYPEFTVTATYDSAAQRVSLTVRQTQVDATAPDSAGPRFTTPSVFRMPVTVRVGTAQGDVVEHAQLDAREQTITVSGVHATPTMVVFDDGDRILKKLAFEEPTTWLATQLRRDPDLWNRWWAIGQLARRPTDSAAALALAAAATGADYDLTRVQATGALAAFPAAVAEPALARAAVDTSSRVRVAAIQSLAELGGADALAAAQQAFEGDSSYDVRAAALAAVVHLDTTGRRDAIARGLGMPSYRDVIQNAALEGIAATGDTTFIPTLDRLMGEQRLVPFTMAALAAHGSAHALALLRAHLNDDRPYVRQWALTALAHRLPSAIALHTLKDAEPALRHADTRAAVEREIGRLEKD